MDDALSCECLGDGRFRVGVHIADVSHFVKKSSQLDSVASQRASSVYLVQTVVPMLPRLLCEELCSLNPGQDRLTFSVEWIIREDGAILSEWFGKSLINSCIKLSYDHAQSVIENSADVSNISNFPSPIFGNWTFEDIRDRILWLNSLATKLRQKRARNGSLHLDQVKVNFHLERGLPLGYVVEAKRDSNRLIEEFMLLANMAVAHKIYKTFPKLSLLRCHPPPLDRGLDDVVEILQDFGIHLNSSSSGSLQVCCLYSLLSYMSEDFIGSTLISGVVKQIYWKR